MNYEMIIQKTVSFVKETLANAEGGHDWWHIYRVWNTAKWIAQYEKCNLLIVELSALLHDIADAKFHNGNEEIGPQIAGEFLEKAQLDPAIIRHVQNIIRFISFKNSLAKKTFDSIELAIVQDADRLDAIGAIGIARAFNYGGFKHRPLYDPAINPVANITKEDYKNSTAPTVNHFYEKLLLLKDKMNTPTGKQLAEDRHTYMLHFLERFYKEWDMFS